MIDILMFFFWNIILLNVVFWIDECFCVGCCIFEKLEFDFKLDILCFLLFLFFFLYWGDNIDNIIDFRLGIFFLIIRYILFLLSKISIFGKRFFIFFL